MPVIQSLKIGVSGVRGVIGESLTPQLVVGFAEAFGTYLGGGVVVIGRDTRPSGEMIYHALVGGLLSAGSEVIDVGVCPAPTIGHAVVDLRADGGIAITASHNPAQWNALKFLRADGMFLNSYQGEELLNVYHQGAFVIESGDALGRVGRDEGAVNRHLSKVISATNRQAIASLHPRVVVDSCNGSGSRITAGLLEKMGCEVIAINDTPDGHFPRDPEPVPENLGQLCEAVKEHGRSGPLVTNLSTSRMIDEVGQRHGCSVLRTKVGEVNVAEAMLANQAVGGGEGNGGVIDPRLHYCRDNLAAMALILEGMATRQVTVKEWAESFRPSAIVKEKTPCSASNIQTVLLALQRKYAGEELDLTEGVKVLWPDAWLHARPSATEPIMRVIAEADDEAAARGLCDEAIEAIDEAIG